MPTHEENHVVTLAALEVLDVGTPEYVLTLMVQMRAEWLNSATTIVRKEDVIRTVNLVIFNMELMIENQAK